jgi:predicted amidophosphoribosyltransferase
VSALASAVDRGVLPVPSRPRVLVPLPDDPARAAERGYSVTGRLAEALGARWGSKVRTDLLVRRRCAPAQAKLESEEARMANVNGLFGIGRLDEIDRDVDLVVVDDQVTTGATMAAAARLAGGRGHRVLALALGGAREAPRQVVA